MTLSKIEKCAKLIGYDGSMFRTGGGFLIEGKTVETGGIFNHLTNKSDLVDLMCALPGLDISIATHYADAQYFFDDAQVIGAAAEYADHPDKCTALAHAVVDVACQIYDRKFGGE